MYWWAKVKLCSGLFINSGTEEKEDPVDSDPGNKEQQQTCLPKAVSPSVGKGKGKTMQLRRRSQLRVSDFIGALIFEDYSLLCGFNLINISILTVVAVLVEVVLRVVEAVAYKFLGKLLREMFDCLILGQLRSGFKE